MTADERGGIASGQYPAKPPAIDTTGATADPEPRTRSAFGAPHSGPAARLSARMAAVADTFVSSRNSMDGRRGRLLVVRTMRSRAIVRDAAPGRAASCTDLGLTPVTSLGWWVRQPSTP